MGTYKAYVVGAVRPAWRPSPARSTCRRSGIINPSEFAPANSIEYVIWVAVGGRGTLVGAALGAVVVNYAKTTFTTGLLAPYWLFVLGALFVLVTIFLPKGILGLIPSRAPRSSSGFPLPLAGRG